MAPSMVSERERPCPSPPSLSLCLCLQLSLVCTLGYIYIYVGNWIAGVTAWSLAFFFFFGSELGHTRPLGLWCVFIFLYLSSSVQVYYTRSLTLSFVRIRLYWTVRIVTRVYFWHISLELSLSITFVFFKKEKKKHKTK